MSYLARIPFRAIITTNYNNLLDGYVDPEVARDVQGGGGAPPAISNGVLNPQHNFEVQFTPKIATLNH